MYVSIDLVEEIIERQIRRYRKKLIDKKQAAQSFSQLFIEEAEEAEESVAEAAEAAVEAVTEAAEEVVDAVEESVKEETEE